MTSRAPTKAILTATVAMVAAGLSACGYVDKYEEAVYDQTPTYCYERLGRTIDCFHEPIPGEEARFVSYTGPHPSRYDAPDPKPRPVLKAPPRVNYWVKDPEPIPRPLAKGDLSDRPWLKPDYVSPEPVFVSPAAAADLAKQAEEASARTILEDAVKRKQAQAKILEEKLNAERDPYDGPVEVRPEDLRGGDLPALDGPIYVPSAPVHRPPPEASFNPAGRP